MNGKWLSIKDAPKTGKHVLVLDWLYSDAGPNVVIARWNKAADVWQAINTYEDLLNITHWMPLPKMPPRPTHFRMVHGGDDFAEETRA